MQVHVSKRVCVDSLANKARNKGRVNVFFYFFYFFYFFLSLQMQIVHSVYSIAESKYFVFVYTSPMPSITITSKSCNACVRRTVFLRLR